MKALTSILAVLTLSSVFVTAEDAPKGDKPKVSVEDRFKKKDTNGDGKLSKEEFTKGAKDAAKAEEMFSKLDKDKDGFLSLEEYKAMGGHKKKADK